MEAPVAVEENDEHRVEESSGGNISSQSSPNQIADPVVYKLVRVEGDGRLVPATDDELMEVEDLLEDEKSDLPLVVDTGQAEVLLCNGGITSVETNLECSEGFAQSEKKEINAEKLNARLEFIGVMLQKVKQEEKLRLSGESPDSSDYVNLDGKCSDQHGKLLASDEKFQPEKTLLETLPLPSTSLNNSDANESGSVETCSKPKDGPINHGSLASAISTGLKPDFSRFKGEICLDNLTIRELHETFKATFGRETSVKDKLWLKRRITMGLTNSCDVSITPFIIRDKTLVRKVDKESRKDADGTLHMGQDIVKDNSKESPSSATNQMEGRKLISGKRLRKPNVEYGCKIEGNNQTEERAVKRVRKPTRRYIEELSEVECRECTGRLVSSVKKSGHYQPSPISHVRHACNTHSERTTFVTREDSLGGSGVQVPYVSRVRRGRPRKNFMALMKFHPSGMGVAAKLVKKALGVRMSQPDSDIANKIWRSGSNPKRTQQPFIVNAKNERKPVVISSLEQRRNVEQENLDPYGSNSDDNISTVSTTKGGTRRKHHRAWTLCEVMKLVEGVSRYGAGRWAEIKRIAFASQTYRTSVDLKDKWRNLLRASFAQSTGDKGNKSCRKHASIPIPAPILLRVRELTEMHTQVAPDLSSNKMARSGVRNVHETRSGYL
ncbi:uncharacterized protein LOC122656495 isoform X2 [Telopea speciosissima]|uniref:uncharacterized protein LOC122656495 isoform X2 n=1 Tax=Telopea speciosissima TaxID=54955 RepID=UPI001CC351E8|nr:uncharacterized protein LOC122656495 isoform X2 [Telopea speciosissima]